MLFSSLETSKTTGCTYTTPLSYESNKTPYSSKNKTNCDKSSDRDIYSFQKLSQNIKEKAWKVCGRDVPYSIIDFIWDAWKYTNSLIGNPILATWMLNLSHT